MAQQRWTHRCLDGRACAGSLGEPVFVPEENYICDACLAARYELQTVYNSCCCGSYSEPTGYDTQGVLAVLRDQRKPTRYYVQSRFEYFDAKGKSIDPNAVIKPAASAVQYAGVYDSEQPWPREPLEEFGNKRMKAGSASARAWKRARELNTEEK